MHVPRLWLLLGCASGLFACDQAPELAVEQPLALECGFGPGARVTETLGFGAAERARLPLRHVIVVMMENRSFDHLLGHMRALGRDVNGFADDFSNREGRGRRVLPAHAASTRIAPDLPHRAAEMRRAWNRGAMDGFFLEAARTGDGRRALAYLDERDLPFHYWLYGTFAMADRAFASVMGSTWPNRDFLYAATSDGVHDTDEREIHLRTLFDLLDEAGVSWAVYENGASRQRCIGWRDGHAGLRPLDRVFQDLGAGTLPEVVFVDPDYDDHPPLDVRFGESWVRRLVVALFASPEWPTTALVLTYDEAGGFFDHVPPPQACLPSLAQNQLGFDQLGFRVPLAVVSPWARRGFVSHARHETASITRLIELVFDLPALTVRDASASALLDLFDFESPPRLEVGEVPAAGGDAGLP